MYPARIAELLQPFLSDPCHSEPGRRLGEEPAVLSPAQLNRISTYIDILLRWNARINLTAIRDPEEIVTRHFGESLFAARHLFPTPALQGKTEKNFSAASASSAVRGLARVADLGSGAGFPGIPIKIWAPDIALTLIESNHKKAIFLHEVVRSLTLTDIDIRNTRAEEVALTQTFDLVTLRAVERFTDALTIAARLLAPTARLALLIAAPQLEAARSVPHNLTWTRPIPIPQSHSRLLLVGSRYPY
jgi:16S rRNA (guanine527-N7)-methyltransferase